MGSPRGMSLAEIAIVMVALGALLLIAVPPLARARDRVEVMAARESFSSAHALARQIAVQYGRVTRLRLDPAGGRFWVTADTSVRADAEILDTISVVVLSGAGSRGVSIEAAPRTFCFDGRGLPTARGACDLPNATIVFRRGGAADTVTVSRLGRVRRR